MSEFAATVGAYAQLESANLRTVVCTCQCPSFFAGMDMSDGTVRFSCQSCGRLTGKFLLEKGYRAIEGAPLLPPGGSTPNGPAN